VFNAPLDTIQVIDIGIEIAKKGTFGRFLIHPWTVCSTQHFLCSDLEYFHKISTKCRF